VAGDKVAGDKISVGNISGSKGIAIGRGAQATVTEGVSGADLVKLFETVYKQIEARPEESDVDKEELADTVQKIEKEAAKGEEARPKKVERWLKFLAGMAPDIAKVTAAALAHPAAGIGTAIALIAEKFKGESATA
jgi:hypothetical protein